MQNSCWEFPSNFRKLSKNKRFWSKNLAYIVANGDASWNLIIRLLYNFKRKRFFPSVIKGTSERVGIITKCPNGRHRNSPILRKWRTGIHLMMKPESNLVQELCTLFSYVFFNFRNCRIHFPFWKVIKKVF